MTGMSAPELAMRLNLHKSGHSWRGDCPACGYRGAFAVKEGRRGWPLLFCSNGCDKGALRERVNGVTGGAYRPVPVQEKAPRPGDRRLAALGLWRASGDLSRSFSTRAVSYLTSRGIGHLASSNSLRFHASVSHPAGGRLPALVALVVDVAGAPIAAHRTYLRDDGSGKAAVTPTKASIGPVWGGVVRLQQPLDGSVVIGEGIETSASAGVLLGLPAWAAISAGNLATGLLLPPDIQSVTIAADNDPPGLKAAETAAARWRAEGRAVRILVPATTGDFNDELCAQESANG